MMFCGGAVGKRGGKDKCLWDEKKRERKEENFNFFGIF